MAEGDLASTLKSGFIVIGLLLAGILFVLLNGRAAPPVDPVPQPPIQSENWTDGLERYCRDTKDRLEAIRREQARQPATREGMQRGIRLEVEWGALEAKLYDSCAGNRELWQYLRETW